MSGRRERPARPLLGMEAIMTVGGLGLAAGSVAFAYMAIQANDGAPRINGVEHLALFAMPNSARDSQIVSIGAGSPAAVPLMQGDVVAPAIDYTPTATIGPALERRQVRSVGRDRVMFDGPSGPLEVRKGESAPGIGRLRDIQRIQGRWIAVIEPERRPTQSSR